MNIENEKTSKIHRIKELATCDNNHTFETHTVLLVPFSSESKKTIGSILVVDNQFDVLTDVQGMVSGYLLACPICKLIHLHGFNRPNNNYELLPGEDNTRPERILQPDL